MSIQYRGIRKALVERRVCLGTWIQIAHPATAEVLANVGFDWIAADCEHAGIDPEAFADLARGMHGRGPAPLARVQANDTMSIRRILDAGAEGVIVPLVNSKVEAKRAVMSSKFPPEGVRGFAFTRSNNWGVDFDEYARTANQETAVVVMIESKQAVESIDDILDVEGVDGVFLGPYDMSGSYGVIGQTSHPDLVDARHRVVDACRRKEKTAGLHIVIPTAENIAETIDEGFTFIALGVDAVLLDGAARSALDAARDIAAQ